MDGYLVRPTALVVLLLALVIGGAAACTIPSGTPLTPTSADGTVRFTGNIISLANGKISGARLTVLSGANKDAQVRTDAAGRYAFASLQPDSFDVLIEAAGFASITPRVYLFNDVDVTFALSVQ
jgi:hypothetical protein